PFAHEDVTIADLDFDKQTDVVQSTDTGYRVWFNRGGGVYSKEVRTPGASYLGQVIRFSEAGVHLAGLNGDRLLDVVRVRPNGIVYCAGMAAGRSPH
ncbi:MAG: VCBS repeat-containing protein, partial [Deltaproteobacteria bacterium]|nr:VCBS repeat-containing protein [Deltaproteobacteria bacterium]